ncbi:Alpha/Beta hydrolase protein [Scheffersomyces xylosifermentans]|uniref:Alpha/Beta hydrolase protein n=1 Tax=Scheffersomyces xylosifermentans TaxID=1304137 RepID=UPI00315D498B
MLRTRASPAKVSSQWILARFFTSRSSLWQKTPFVLPPDFKETRSIVKSIPFSQCYKIWRRSIRPNRLKELQDELVELMLPSDLEENSGINRQSKKVQIDKDGNFINEVNFEIVNDPSLDTKHVVFIHGYGASLGCFARNFQLIQKLKSDKSHNYSVHFLDNITFGLSSNPRIDNVEANKWKLYRCPTIKLNDPDQPTDPKKLYNKYYKLIEGYEVNVEEFKKYQEHYSPILKDLDDFYTSAIEKWRIAYGLDKIDYLVGHSFGAYWSGSYAVRYPKNLKNLILLSPVGVERHVQAVTNDTFNDAEGIAKLKPSLDPTSYKFLTRIPVLSQKHVFNWYFWLPFVPRFLRWLGPWGVSQYYRMWLGKLLKINKFIKKQGGAANLFTSNNDLAYGTKKEVLLIIEYLYNSITSGSNSDIYIKNLLTPSTVSKWPLYDKFYAFLHGIHKPEFNIHLLYGQFDFMNVEAGEKLVELIDSKTDNKITSFYKVSEGGHNLYIDNPFETNQLIHDIIIERDQKK